MASFEVLQIEIRARNFLSKDEAVSLAGNVTDLEVADTPAFINCWFVEVRAELQKKVVSVVSKFNFHFNYLSVQIGTEKCGLLVAVTGIGNWVHLTSVNIKEEIFIFPSLDTVKYEFHFKFIVVG